MINDILISYFNENDFVLIPRKGVFIKTKDSNTGLDPIVFIYNPAIDYTDIIAYTKTALDIDDNAANTIIEGFCALMDSQLKNKGEYHIDGIATLCTDHKWGIYMTAEGVKPQVKPQVIETEQATTHSRRLEDIISEKTSTEKRLDTILAEPHQRKIDISAPITFADKYKKTNDQATDVNTGTINEPQIEPQDELPIDKFAEGTKITEQRKEEERHDKLNEIFASKRVNNASNELSDRIDELYKTKKVPTSTNNVATSITAPDPILATADNKTEEYVMPKKKKIDKTMIFFITSIMLFLCALCYYFIVRNDIELILPSGEEVIQTEQIEATE